MNLNLSADDGPDSVEDIVIRVDSRVEVVDTEDTSRNRAIGRLASVSRKWGLKHLRKSERKCHYRNQLRRKSHLQVPDKYNGEERCD
jgi:hypothetical protein